MTQVFRGGALAAFVLLLLGPALPGADKIASPRKIQRAVKRGVAFLQSLQKDDGTWAYLPRGNENVGSTALAALTVLECGVPAKDKGVQKAADLLRARTISLTDTYSLALAILFLDRLGDPGDVALIESMTVRLLAGQSKLGTWTYTCPAVSEAEVNRLTDHVKQRAELVAKGKLPKKRPGRRTERDLPREIVAQVVQINRQQAGREGTEDDLSNTQFATLALWVSRRHGLPVDAALERLANRCRTLQLANGAWAYKRPPGMGALMSRNPRHMGTGAMTCAGLLGLAVGQGAVQERRQARDPKAKKPLKLSKDRSLRDGLNALAACIGEPAADPKAVAVLGDWAGRSYYYLWSLERVAMIYGLRKIGKKDWYTWGSQILLTNQSSDGGWNGAFRAGGVDTCFALLFLRRSNLAADLTSTLRGVLPASGEVALKTGGVGGRALVLGKDIRAGVRRRDKNEKPDDLRPKQKKAVLADPGDDQAAQIARLSAALVKAPAKRQGALLDKLKESKGVVYTEALAGSIPLLKGDLQARARQALAERLLRMSVGTLRDKLHDDNLEIRRAAARACAQKKVRTLIPDLIALLTDPEPPVARSAHQALKDLTGKDFGPEADATRAERKAAVKKWRAWWKKQKGEN
jgi:hypothetical protein